MPDNSNNSNSDKDLPAVRADSPKAEEKVRLPETPDERRKRRLKEAEAESDDARSARRKLSFKSTLKLIWKTSMRLTRPIRHRSIRSTALGKV